MQMLSFGEGVPCTGSQGNLCPVHEKGRTWKFTRVISFSRCTRFEGRTGASTAPTSCGVSLPRASAAQVTIHPNVWSLATLSCQWASSFQVQWLSLLSVHLKRYHRVAWSRLWFIIHTERYSKRRAVLQYVRWHSSHAGYVNWSNIAAELLN